MRHLIVGAAVAILAMTAPSLASAGETRAVAGAHYTNLDSDAFGDSVDVFGLDGKFSHDFGNAWTFQGEAQSDRADSGGGADDGLSYSAINLGYKDDKWSAYGWVGLADEFGFSASHVGLGGQLFFDKATVSASVAYADIDGVDSNPTQIAVSGTWFFTDNLGVSAHVSHTDADGFFGFNDDWNTYGVSAEYRFEQAPVSISLGYSSSDTDPDNVDAWRVGLHYDFGSGSLKERSQRGPGWTGASDFFNDFLGGV